jgi:hypothetical protein
MPVRSGARRLSLPSPSSCRSSRLAARSGMAAASSAALSTSPTAGLGSSTSTPTSSPPIRSTTRSRSGSRTAATTPTSATASASWSTTSMRCGATRPSRRRCWARCSGSGSRRASRSPASLSPPTRIRASFTRRSTSRSRAPRRTSLSMRSTPSPLTSRASAPPCEPGRTSFSATLRTERG